MLIAAFKVAQKASLFNFEAVHTKYKNYMASHQTQLRAIMVLSKQAFLKIFLDLVDKGFLRSENETEILSVNNKISLGFRLQDLDATLQKDFGDSTTSTLPRAIVDWIRMNWIKS